MTTGRRIFQGEFGEILIPDILTFLDMIGKTGTLSLKRGADTKNIYWDRGEIAYADSSVRDEQIGDYLCRNGWIDPEPLEEARASTSRPDDLVKALLRKGAVEPAVLPRAVKLLVLDIVYSLFDWHDGSFAFDITPAPHAEKVVLRTSVSNIIMEGTRRLDEWERIREFFPSDEMYIHLVPESDAISVKLPPLEQDVLSRVTGRATIRDIVRLVDPDQFTVLNALLTLNNAGLITASRSPLAERTEDPGSDALTDDERRAAQGIVDAFGNIFAGIQERIARAKGSAGVDLFSATIKKGAFQKVGVLDGVAFTAEGRLPADAILRNLSELPDGERLSRLKGTLDRLLAQQVLQLDTSYPPEEKKAVSDLIAREKGRLAAV